MTENSEYESLIDQLVAETPGRFPALRRLRLKFGIQSAMAFGIEGSFDTTTPADVAREWLKAIRAEKAHIEAHPEFLS